MNSFARVMKTGLDGTVIWKYDFTMYQDPIRNLVSFNITKNIGGDGYVICGAINDDTLDYSNNLKPFTFEIDDFGNFRTFHEYSFLSFKGAALKIVNTDDGQYAMTGMIGDQFDTLTSNERMGFLTQLDANFNVIWWQHFASSHSRTMLPSNAPRFDWANEVISFKRPGDQYDVYFVGGAQTKQASYSTPWVMPHNTQGWLFDNLGNIIWTVNECLEYNAISTAIYDSDENAIYAGTNAENGSNGPHNHLIKIDAATGNILDRIHFEGGAATAPCEASGHAMSITNLKIEGDYIYVMGYNQQINVYGSSFINDVYNPFISKLDKNNLTSMAYKSYIWDDNTQSYPTAHPSIVGVLGYQYPQSFGDYLNNVGINATSFKGHMSYNPRAFIKDNDKLYFLSFDNTHTSPLWDIVLKTNNSYNDYCHTQEWNYLPDQMEWQQPILSTKYSPSWTSEELQLQLPNEPQFNLFSCSSVSCAYPSSYFRTQNTKEELKSENFKNTTANELLEELSSNNQNVDYYIVIHDITGKLIYSNQNNSIFYYNGLTSGLYVITKIYPSNPNLNNRIKFIKP
jgi:hypothetical protein